MNKVYSFCNFSKNVYKTFPKIKNIFKKKIKGVIFFFVLFFQDLIQKIKLFKSVKF